MAATPSPSLPAAGDIMTKEALAAVGSCAPSSATSRSASSTSSISIAAARVGAPARCRSRLRLALHQGQARHLQLSRLPWLIHKFTTAGTTTATSTSVATRRRATSTRRSSSRFLNEVDRFHLAIDVIDRVPRLQASGAHLKTVAQYDHRRDQPANEIGLDRAEDTS